MLRIVHAVVLHARRKWSSSNCIKQLCIEIHFKQVFLVFQVAWRLWPFHLCQSIIQPVSDHFLPKETYHLQAKFKRVFSFKVNQISSVYIVLLFGMFMFLSTRRFAYIKNGNKYKKIYIIILDRMLAPGFCMWFWVCFLNKHKIWLLLCVHVCKDIET